MRDSSDNLYSFGLPFTLRLTHRDTNLPGICLSFHLLLLYPKGLLGSVAKPLLSGGIGGIEASNYTTSLRKQSIIFME